MVNDDEPADSAKRSDLLLREWSEAQIRERAVSATGMSFTVADARRPGQPLIWVNPAFTATTGYTFEEAVGHNCRFLQGPDTDPAEPMAMREALTAGCEITLTLLNYRKDGSTFWNEVTISPVLDGSGDVTHFVGIQADVTARVEAGAERDRALDAERRAVTAAELARGRLALLAEASNELAFALDVDETLRRLADIIVPALADWVLIHRAGDDGVLSKTPIVRARAGLDDVVRRYAALAPTAMKENSPVYRLWNGEASWLIEDFSTADAAGWATDPDLVSLRDQLGMASLMFVALPGRDHIVGSMVLNRSADRPTFGPDDLQVAVDLGRRAGLSVDNARLYENEHRIAETLQRSLLPKLPDIAGLDIAARYRASQDGVKVGGDFYDVLDLPDGAVAVVIGDVVGHDLSAAAAMGHLHGLIRAVAWDAETPRDAAPDAILGRVDRVVQGLHVTSLATVAYARLEQRPAGSWMLRSASAGHPPILLRDPDGSARFVESFPGLLLGFRPSERITSAQQVGPGCSLLAFTDGLVERRSEDLDVGLEHLRHVVEGAPLGLTADQLCQFVIDRLEDGDDDTALLVIRIL
jgi:PAS domain S-box-containing protein